MAKYLVSPIVYMGSKRRLMEQLLNYIPRDIDTAFDVFGGSGTVALNIPAMVVHLNEWDTNLHRLHDYYINTSIIQIQEDIDETLTKYGNGKTLTESQFKQLREDINKSKIEDISQFNVLIQYAFQKLLRYNSKGEFNTSYNNRSTYPSKDYFKKVYSFSDTLLNKQVQLSNLDFRELDYSGLTESDFVYFDPPYLNTEATYTGGWSLQDEQDLYNLIQQLTKQGVRWGLSNVMTHRDKTNPWVVKLADEFTLYHLDIEYNPHIGETKTTNVKADEVYITNVKPM